MARPLIQCGIADLETTFAGASQDPTTLRALKQELGFRQVPRAVALLAKVNLALTALAPAVDLKGIEVVLETPEAQLDLQSTPGPKLFSQSSGTQDAVVASQLVPRQSSPVKLKSSKKAFDLTAQAAYGLLQATASSTWESIEEKRRTIVQRASPENTFELDSEEREQMMVEAERANAAYALLLGERAKNIN